MNRTHHPSIAEAMGRDARRNGTPRSDDPLNGPAASDWTRGWDWQDRYVNALRAAAAKQAAAWETFIASGYQQGAR